ncbi:hypothetical protein V5E97_29100 [Singulisphaera sp. Ch08]|uniref:DUF1574 domain-containing protein n=1 Tax=Singulisphaera sp. Ch08 TaxID=3120278 RepID=A0AAU7CB70_9BACT
MSGQLAGNPPARARVSTSIPWGLLGMLGLLALIECGVVARHPLDFSDPVSLSWQLSAQATHRDAPGCTILGVGDSLVKHGVIPSVLEAETGERVCNLAVARGPAPATYFLLRRALDAGARPKAIVVDFKPGVLVGSPRYNLRYWQEILTVREGLDLARHDHGGSLLVNLALGRLLPTFRGRLEVRGAILAALRGEDSPMRLINRVCQRNWGVNDGANVAARNPAFNGEVSAEQHKTLLSHLWYCHRVNKTYVRRILDLTAERGIRVYWLLPPVSPALQTKREETGAESGYLKFVRSFQHPYPHLTIVDGRHAGYDHTAFVDATHLDGRGAFTLTTELGRMLRRDLAGDSATTSRWVNLPPYRPDPSPVPLEDVEESRIIVKSGR